MTNKESSALTLTAFLLRRIESDEAVTREATPNTLSTSLVASEASDREGVTELLIDPARVLADCAARRAIVELAAWEFPRERLLDSLTMPTAQVGYNAALELTLRHLASVYCDHLDFDPTWTVS